MPILLLALAVGVLAYFWWRQQRTTLTRDCRWRQDKRRGGWHCVACGAVLAGQSTAPRECLKER